MTSTVDAHRLESLLRNTNATTIRNVLVQWPLRRVTEALAALPVTDQARC